jgi:hypothetical protein
MKFIKIIVVASLIIASAGLIKLFLVPNAQPLSDFEAQKNALRVKFSSAKDEKVKEWVLYGEQAVEVSDFFRVNEGLKMRPEFNREDTIKMLSYVNAGDNEALKKVIEDGNPDMEATHEGLTPLLIAYVNDNKKIIEFLEDHGYVAPFSFIQSATQTRIEGVSSELVHLKSVPE